MSARHQTYWAFIDSSAYYAMADDSERAHREARAIQQRLINERWSLFTTNFILTEIHALILSRIGYRAALHVLQEIDTSNTTIVRVNEDDERRSRVLIARYDDKAYSLTDALSFVVMERLGISHAFTFDRHFRQYGLTLLTPL